MESYNRPTEQYLLGEYLKAVPDLTILEPHVETVNSEDIESLKQRVALLEEANKKLLDDQKEYNEVLEDPRLQKLLLNMVREAIGSFGTAGSKKQERKPTH